MAGKRSVFLTMAFGALLLSSAAAAWAVWRNTDNAQRQVTLLRDRDLQVHQALDTIRTSVYSTAILTRDYLLAPQTISGRSYLEQFTASQPDTRLSFEILNRAAQDRAHKETLARLKVELDAYWNTTRVLLTRSTERDPNRAEMLGRRLQRRQDIFALTQEIERLTSLASAQERERWETVARNFRSSLGWTAGIALLLSIAISVLTLNRMRALETQSQAAEAELRLLTGQLRTTQEEERKTLSRELHDQVGQMLTGLKMELTAVSQLHASPESEVTSRLASARGTVEQTLGIVRNIAMLLRPSMLDDLGLTPALNWLVKESSRSSGLNIEADVNAGVDDLPDAHRTCLYRVVQEALTNAIRHASASSVDVHVDCAGNWVHATISDDGKGFEPGAEKRKGLGLLGMEERVRELGGTIRVASAPGRGTSIEIRLPRPLLAEETDDQNPDWRRPRDRSDRLKTAP